jgi:hypothetical protein
MKTLRIKRAHLGLGLVCGAWACATVTQEDPPSMLARGAAGSSATFPGDGEQGGAPRAAMVALPTQAATQPGATQGSSADPGASDEASAAPNTPAPGDATPPPVPASGTTLLQEDFENFGSGPVVWSPSDGSAWAVQLDSGRNSHVYAQTETESTEPHLATAGDLAWGDMIVQADLQVLQFNGKSSSYMAGLCLRVRDGSDFYLIGLRSNDGKIGLRRYANGGTNLVQSEFDTGTTGVWYTLRAEIVGSTLSASLNGAPMFSTTDSALTSGRIALCTVRASALFDNVSVTAP